MPYDCIALCTGEYGTAFDFGYAGVALLAGVSNSKETVAHEIGHIVGLAHLTSPTCCGTNYDANVFMCDGGGKRITLNEDAGCQGQNWMNTHIFTSQNCSLWADQQPEFSDDHVCPVTSTVQIIINADNPNPVKNCKIDGDITTLSVTIINDNTVAMRNIRAVIGDSYKTIASFVNDPLLDFDCIRTFPGNRSEFWITNGNDDPGTIDCEGETFFSLAPGETAIFKLKVKFLGVDPVLGKDFIVSFYTGTSLPPFTSQTKFSVVPYAVVPGGTFASLFTNGIWKSNNPLIFSGTVVMNNTSLVDFGQQGTSNPKLLFMPGTGLEIASGSSVKMPHIQVEGCLQMWKGITIKQGGALETTTMTSIKDAQYAINVQKGGTIKSIDCLFLNNNYAVRTAPEGTGNYNITLLGNQFGTDGNGLKTPYSGQVPAPFGSRGYAGIYLVDAGSLALQSSSAHTENKFFTLHNGIIVQNTNIAVKNTIFENIEKMPGAPGLANNPFFVPGNGIYIDGGSLSVTGGGILAASPETFINCHTAIENRGASLTVSQNKMRTVNNGVVSRIGINKTVAITFNDIEGRDMGIGVYHASALGNGCLVGNNTISMSGNADGVGISTGGSGSFAQSGGNFISNTVTMYDGKAGIQAGVSNNLKITQNIVATGSTSKYGIGISGGDLNTVNCNNISGSGEKGIYGMMAGRSAFICNNMLNTGVGLHFDGVFVGKGAIPVAGNTMANNAGGGLLMGADAVIGEQVHRGNKWTGGGPTLAEHLGGVGISAFSRFKVDPNENAVFLPGFVNPSGWFQSELIPTLSYQCIPGSSCPLITATPDAAKDKEIAKGELNGFSHQATQLWLAQRRLSEKLTEGGNPYFGDSDFDKFLIDIQSNGIKGYADLQIGLRQIFNLNTNDLSDLDSYESQIAQDLNQLGLKEALLNVFGISQPDSTNLAVQRNAILQNLATITAQRENKLSSILSTRSSSATTLLSQNNALGGTLDYLVNEKTVNGIFLQTIASGNNYFSAAQLSSLQSIAWQCALSGGEAVLTARDMLALAQETVGFFDDDALCNPMPRTSKGSTSIFENKIKIFPNPANDQITIQYDLKKTGGAHLKFFNVYGQLTQEVFLPDIKGTLLTSVNNLTSGIYFYSLDGVTTGKIIINH